jgi:hypothetical protein
MTDIVERLRERHYRLAAESNDEANNRRQRDREEAADVIERQRADVELCRLYERFSNSVIRGQVLDAIAHKQATGKYPFED